MAIKAGESIIVPFKGGAYEGRSKDINAQRSINMFRVRDNQEAKVTTAMYGTPGYDEFGDTGTTAIMRGIHMMGDHLYAVVGANIYRVAADGTVSLSLDTMSTSTGKVGMADNGTEVLIVDGSTAAYVVTASACTEIGPGDNYPQSIDCVFFDGYFVTVDANGYLWISGLYDGSLWEGDNALAEANPDGLVGIATTTRNLWLIGERSTEIYYNSGNADFPLERMPGAVKPVGCISGNSISEINGEIYWLSDKGVIVKSEGYNVVPVSEDGINYQIGQYTTKSDAIGWSYTLEGMTFYVLNFPSHNKTWVVNLGTNDWHEWRYGTDTMHRGVAAINRGYLFNGAVIIGDRSNGKLYTLSMDTYTDDGDLITRVRRAQVINKNRVNVLHSRIELEFESGRATGDAEPMADLTWSDDGAETWARTRSVPIGSYKKFTTRSVWRELGASRNRVYELTVAEDMKFVLIEAYQTLTACAV